MEKLSETSIKQGICPDCGGKMKKWSDEEIAEAKVDLGMSDDGDFFDCCCACAAKYQ